MHRKLVANLTVKAADQVGLKPGQFVWYASVFGNVDSYGDIVEPGAFTDTLAAWAVKGDPIPCLWGHDFYDPFSNIGAVLEATQDEKGLRVLVQLDLDNPKAVQVQRLLTTRRATQMSFAYDVIDSKQDGEVTHLLKVDLFEVSVVPLGANPETEIVDAKSLARALAAKAGRVISAKNETTLRTALASLDDAASQIKDVLAALDEAAPPDNGKAAPDHGAKTEEPPGAKAEEPDGTAPADHRKSVLASIELAATAAVLL